MCCFERSRLPEHEGKRVVVLRVTRLLDSDPIRPVRLLSDEANRLIEKMLRPREGGLLMNIVYRTVRPWMVDVDSKTGATPILGAVLRVLFENEGLYGPFQQPKLLLQTGSI